MDLDSQKIAEIERLVECAQRGDAEAFGKLYDMFVSPIYRYMYYRVGVQEAEDLTELVFLKTWENIRQYRRVSLNPGRSRTFSAWIFRIAHNVVVDHYRAHQTTEELSEEMEDHRRDMATPHQAHRRFEQELLSDAMKELKDHYRQILILKYVNELSNEEIEAVMGRSQAALRILQFRALRSLRKILERKGISPQDA